MAENKDVDLYAELKKTLESVDEPEEKESLVPSDQKPKEDVDTSKEKVDIESEELSEEEISKLGPKAQKRIREQAAEIKRLAELPPKEEKPQEDKKPDSQKFKDVQEFLSAVQDEPSRNLLSKFYEVIKGETSSILAPIEKANAEAKFNEEFGRYEKIEGLSDYKNDLKKTFLRDPNQSLKALIGEVVTDLQLNKVKPIEKTPSSPNREGKVNLDNLSTEELYDHLASLKE